ncbi:MAG: glycosyltransferase [Proteobacteria bacterium]|nr:glycosyltransferase [Pseudomonadota bacterium]MBU1715351.1 glycosyltransferase [Pseudomonadota bacterium]
MYSIIIPAFNEAECLAATLLSVKEAMARMKGLGEFIVVDNNSTDQTAKIAASYGAKVVFEPINQISRARNAGAKVAKGEYFIFLDADTIITAELLRETLQVLSANSCCGGGALVEMGESASVIGKSIFMLFVALAQIQNTATGCFIFCRADAYHAVGGFNERLYATEEYFFSLKLKKWGRKNGMPFKLLRQVKVLTSSRKFEAPASLVSMLVTILVPFSIFFRSTCGFWYKRDGDVKKKKDG